MKKLLLSLMLLAVAGVCFGQAKKPTIMVVPSDVWCVKNGYVTNFDNQGVVEQLPDYEKALKNDTDLLLVVSKLGELMAANGFLLKDLESSLKRIKTEEAEESLTTSKDTGEGLAESPVEKLKRVAKADIWMQVTWSLNRVGPKSSLTFNLQGKDAYTDKQVAAASGTQAPDASLGSELPVILVASVQAKIREFNIQLQAHFDNLFKEGREVTFSCRRWNDSEFDFESEFDGEQLGTLIENWVADNTVEGRFSTTDMTENRIYFEQVRIPMINDAGRAVDARIWANGLRKELRDKYGVDSKLTMKGLGGAVLTIGGK